MAWHKPGEGPPDHLHFSRDELFFILEGSYELTIADQAATAGRGTIAFIPRNTVHRFKNVGDTTACMLDLSLPGGHDHFFKAIAELATRGDFTIKTAMETGKAFDANFLASNELESDTAATPVATDSRAESASSAAAVFDLITGRWRSEILHAGIELGV